MSISNRFGQAFSSAEVELACSLPICNRDNEVLFFYSTKPNDESSYFFGTVQHVFSRDNKSGQVVELSTFPFSKKGLEACSGCIIKPKIMDEIAMDTEDKYYALYEQFYENAYNSEQQAVFSDCCRQLLSCFNELIPDGPLKELYEEIGTDYFEYLREHS